MLHALILTQILPLPAPLSNPHMHFPILAEQLFSGAATLRIYPRHRFDCTAEQCGYHHHHHRLEAAATASILHPTLLAEPNTRAALC
jgi:hypothetical protein